MKRSNNIAAVTALTLGLAATAWAWAGEAGISKPEGPDEFQRCMEKFGPKDPAERTRMMEQHLAELHTKLKLDAAQESAWDVWSGQTKKHLSEIKDKRPDRGELEKLSAPEKMEKWLEFGKERQAQLEEGLAATKSFYAILSAEQKQTFDREFDFFKHGKWGKKHRPAD